MSEERIPPVHPGEVLLEDFLKPLGISQYRLAKEMKVYPRKINEIVHGNRAITADTALRRLRIAAGRLDRLVYGFDDLGDRHQFRAAGEPIAAPRSPYAGDQASTALLPARRST